MFKNNSFVRSLKNKVGRSHLTRKVVCLFNKERYFCLKYEYLGTSSSFVTTKNENVFDSVWFESFNVNATIMLILLLIFQDINV